MDISHYIELFVKQKHAYKPYAAIYKNVLLGGKPYSLNMQTGYQESEYLPYSIKDSVRAYSSNKDIMIALYKDFVSYLEHKGVQVPEIKFPPVPVSNTFERLMFIAKYLQEEENRISDLPDILWVSGRTIEEDISRLRGVEDPIQVCGRKFFIPDTKRENGSMRFSSTAHPLFLAENLTPILIPSNVTLHDDGEGGVYVYPKGDDSVAPSGHFPADGYYFDNLERPDEDFDEDDPDASGNVADYMPVSDEQIAFHHKVMEEIKPLNRAI